MLALLKKVNFFNFLLLVVYNKSRVWYRVLPIKTLCLKYESLLESVKSTLKPIPSYFKTKMNGDDLNSITSSDFSNRSDIEKMSAVNDFIITNLNAENSHLSKQTDENKNNYISNENNEKSIIFSKSDHSFHSTNSKIIDTEDFDVKK